MAWKFFESPVILPKWLIAWGLNPGRLGASLTHYLETISPFLSIVNIKLKYVTLNTAYATDERFLPESIPVIINGYSVHFLSYYKLVLLIDLHKQLLFATGKDPARTFSDIWSMIRSIHSSGLVTYLVSVLNPR